MFCTITFSNKSKIEWCFHTDTIVLGDCGLILHYHHRPVDVYSCDPSDENSSISSIDAIEDYIESHTEQLYSDVKSSNLVLEHFLAP